MIAPRFKKDYENKSIEELVKEQQKIMKNIIDFENKYILKTEKRYENPEAVIIRDPSPTVRWRVDSIDLVMITNLIDEKTRDENGVGIDFEI